ncbi:unusual floral organs-like protein [Tanacetum coccineum]
MWDNLPSDVLANVFSYLTPCSLARAMVVLPVTDELWRETRANLRHRQAMFIALPTRSNSKQLVIDLCRLLEDRFDIVLSPPEGVLLCCQFVIRLLVNLVTFHICKNQGDLSAWWGVREDFTNHFKLYVAGEMSEAANGGAASYEPTLEVFNSKSNKWTVMGSMPVEFAVRVTVWTPNESVYANRVLYWMTSARAYSIMGYEMDREKLKELGVPMGDTLEFATLVPSQN